jgi:TolA-binding protein
MTMTCPNELELARAASEGSSAELAAHLAACATCARAVEADREAIALARRIAVRVPAPEQCEEMRTSILAAGAAIRSAPPARRTRAWVVAGTLAAAAATLGFVLVPRGDGHVAFANHGTVQPHGGARYAASALAPDEIVTLHDGAIDVEVSPLPPGSRFRVVTADSEIEVRGTAFEVSAQLGRLTGVIVRHGLVEVRVHGGAPRLLATGETWSAPPAITAEAAAPAPTDVVVVVGQRVIATPAPARRAPRIAATVAPAPGAAPPARPERSPQDLAYDAAWVAMRAGDFGKAATTFARVGILDPDGPLAEDASFWYAVALARAKRTEAMSAFRELLDRYPRSSHVHEASAMLGWILVDAHVPDEAERRFRAALAARSPKVRESARAGLAALGKH